VICLSVFTGFDIGERSKGDRDSDDRLNARPRYDAGRFHFRKEQKCKMRPLVEEVAEGVDNIRLTELVLHESHDVRKIRFTDVRLTDDIRHYEEAWRQNKIAVEVDRLC
jgi:hypothetical protein